MKIVVKGAKGIQAGKLGSKGIDLDVYHSKKTPEGKPNRLGDLRIGKAKLTWCHGKTAHKNGKVRTWEELISWFESA